VKDGAHEHFDGVLSANGVACFIDVASKTLEVMLLDVLHAGVVQ
jgi:hypothetical protein